MEAPSPKVRELARRLLAASPSAPGAHAVAHVSERLRIPLIKLVGTDGFTALLRRAIALASAEVPALRSISLGADGQLQGLDKVDADARHEAAAALAANLLGLLVMFIGTSLTLLLIGEAWPDLPLNELKKNLETDR